MELGAVLLDGRCASILRMRSSRRSRTAPRATTIVGTASKLRPYKEDERALFRAIYLAMVLFSDPAMAGELRYFEVAPGGFSTLERHEHMHGVLILRGRGHCLVGDEGGSRSTRTAIFVTVPPMAWHQFLRASRGRAARLSLHGECRARPSAAADG